MKQFCVIIASINVLLYGYFTFKSSKSQMKNDIEEIEGYKNFLGEDNIKEMIQNISMLFVSIQILYLAFIMILFYNHYIFKYITFAMMLFLVIIGLRNFLKPNIVTQNKFTTKYYIYHLVTNIIILIYNLFVFINITSLNFT
jgi:hypothetical protein